MKIISGLILLIILNSSYLLGNDEIYLNMNCVDFNSLKTQFPNIENDIIENEKFISEFKKNNFAQSDRKYIIPVVVHVFGTNFLDATVNDEVIKIAIQKTNEDFWGDNDDFNSVYHIFRDLRGVLDIEFKLATIDPNGNETTGILYHKEESGFGRADQETNLKIQQYAWDNYKYMNVYIMLDLYANNRFNNSGVAWYPSTTLSDNNLSRVVYNGRYLYGNTDKEFASVLTHEFGHWLNLMHTFQDGCTYPNDRVDDTPPVNQAGSGCISKNCEDNHINGENYMDYNASCYKMFTIGQVERMIAALNLPSRFPLWQEENLIATGTLDINSVDLLQDFYISAYPNPVYQDIINIRTNAYSGTPEFNIFDVLGQNYKNKVNFSTNNINNEFRLDLKNLKSGVYFINIFNPRYSSKLLKVIKK